MSKLTDRSAISAGEIDSALFIHVVDTTPSNASYKVTLGNLSSVFVLAGGGQADYTARWTDTETLAYGVIQDNGAQVHVGGSPVLSTMLKVTPVNKWGLYVDSSQNTSSMISAYIADISNTGSGNIEAFYSTSAGSNDASADVSLFHSKGVTSGVQANSYGLYLTAHSAGTAKWGIYQAGAGDSNYFNGQLQLAHTAGTAGQFFKSADTSGTGEWASITASDVSGAVTATSGASQRVAVFDGTDSVEGDSNFTWDGFEINVTDVDNNLTEVRADWLRVYNETDDANLFLYGYGSAHRGEIVLGASNGTRGGETAITNGNTTATISAWGHTGSTGQFRQGGQLIFQATENYAEGIAYGTRFILQTVADGSTTLATRYATDGNGDHNFTGNVQVSGQAYSPIQNTIASATPTIDWDDGNVVVVELGGQASDVTLTLNNPKAGAQYLIKIIQGASGVDVIFPNTVKFAGNTTQPYVLDVTATNNAIDVVALTCISDSGTVEYLANVSQNYG